MTTPHPVERDDVMAFLDGELSPERAERVRAHLETCAACRALEADLRRVSATLQFWEVESAPTRLADAVGSALHASPAGGSAPGGSWWAGLSLFPRWGLAAASLAGAALVLVVIGRPNQSDTAAVVTEPAAEMAGRLDEKVAPASPEARRQVAQAPAGLAEADRTEPRATPSAADARREVAARDVAAVAEPVPDLLRTSPAGTSLPGQAATLPPPPPTEAAAPPPPATPPPPPPALPPVRTSAAAAQLAGANAQEALRFADASRTGLDAGPPADAPMARYDIAAEDLAAARLALGELSETLGGRLDDEVASGEGSGQTVRVTLQVPVGRQAEVLPGLEAIGTVQPSDPDADAESVAQRAGRSAARGGGGGVARPDPVGLSKAVAEEDPARLVSFVVTLRVVR